MKGDKVVIFREKGLYFLLAENERVLILEFIGDKAVVAETHFHADFERDGGSSSFADKFEDLIHDIHLTHTRTQLPQFGQKYSHSSQEQSCPQSSSKLS